MQWYIFYITGGPYAAFGGRDASRGLATFSVACEKEGYDDLSDLNPQEMESVREWEMQFTGMSQCSFPYFNFCLLLGYLTDSLDFLVLQRNTTMLAVSCKMARVQQTIPMRKMTKTSNFFSCIYLGIRQAIYSPIFFSLHCFKQFSNVKIVVVA